MHVYGGKKPADMEVDFLTWNSGGTVTAPDTEAWLIEVRSFLEKTRPNWGAILVQEGPRTKDGLDAAVKINGLIMHISAPPAESQRRPLATIVNTDLANDIRGWTSEDR